MKGVFLGYSPTLKGYKYLVSSSEKCYITKDVTSHEECAYFSENSPQIENRGDSEEYSHQQEVRFVEFLEYIFQNDQMKWDENHVEEHG